MFGHQEKTLPQPQPEGFEEALQAVDGENEEGQAPKANLTGSSPRQESE